MGASAKADRAGRASPEPASSLGHSATIPCAEIVARTNIDGAQLRVGAYLGDWDEDEFPYGHIGDCPFCKEAQNYTELFYNGPGSPPSYAVCCGHCGAQGPTSSGNFRGDHWGARLDAVRLWNAAQGIDAGTATTAGRGPKDESPVA